MSTQSSCRLADKGKVCDVNRLNAPVEDFDPADAAKPFHKRRDGHPGGGRGNKRPKKRAITPRPPKTRTKPDACMRLSPTLASRRNNHPGQLLLGRFNHRNRRVNYRRPLHLNNHSQGCFQGDIAIFGTGAVTILLNA